MLGVSIVYNELRNKGIEFPKTSTEPKVPIYTPQRISPGYKGSDGLAPPKMTVSPGTSPPNQSSSTRSQLYPIHLSPEQLNKLKVELGMVQGNMKVFSQMLAELKPGKEHKDDWKLLIELHSTLHSMQMRIVELIEKIANEEVTNELLKINDDLNNLFMRFERHQKKRFALDQPDCISNIPSTSNSQATQNNLSSLIDFTDDNEEPDLVSGLKQIDLKSTLVKPQPIENMGDKEFDMFAQSRSTTIPATNPIAKPEETQSKDPASLLETNQVFSC